MKIDQNDLNSQQQLKKLDQEYKVKIAQRENEIEKVKDLYDKKIKDQIQIGEEAYANKIEQNNLRVENTSKDVELKLKEYQDKLSKTKLELDIEENQLKEAHNNQIDSIKKHNEENIGNLYTSANDSEEKIHFKTENEIKNLDTKSRNEVRNLENQSHRNISNISNAFSNKSVDLERDFRNRLSEDIRNHQEQLYQSNEEFKRIVNNQTEKNQRLEKEKVRVQADELNFLDAYHKNLMEQKNKDFQVRYQNVVDEHNRLLSDITTKLNNDIESIKKKTENTKKNLETVSSDSFYQVEKLNPEIKDVGQSYIVSLEVPEYEKENVHLVAHGRNVKVTLNKKFMDTITDDDGTINKSSKSQLYSKELKVADLLNPKKITAKYELGILQFKIDKA